MENLTPDYKRIYTDILIKKFHEKKQSCKKLLEKRFLSGLDIIRLNETIFGRAGLADNIFNQRHRSYQKSCIIQILKYQKTNKLNNTQLAFHFKLSRNTVAKWKKIFLI
jgi:dephospho-CoA kinase